MRRCLLLIGLFLFLPDYAATQPPGGSGSGDSRGKFSRFGRSPGSGGPTAPGAPGTGTPGSSSPFSGRSIGKGPESGSGGTPPMGMSGKTDPSQLFSTFSKGGDFVRRDDLPPPLQGMFDRAAPQLGVTNGMMNRQQFDQMMQGIQAMRQSMESPDSQSRFAEDFFRRSDRNGDGLLNFDEMSDSLKSEREKWDTNRDGFIDLTEYSPYLQGRLQQRSQERSDQGGSRGSSAPSRGRDDDDNRSRQEEEKKPVVYRAGKLPKDLPSWFSQYDTDADAQIGLYEWKTTGKSFDEFREMDWNDDGFVTVAEALRHKNAQSSRTSSGSVASGGSSTSSGSRSGLGNIMGMFGRRPSDSSSGSSRGGSR